MSKIGFCWLPQGTWKIVVSHFYGNCPHFGNRAWSEKKFLRIKFRNTVLNISKWSKIFFYFFFKYSFYWTALKKIFFQRLRLSIFAYFLGYQFIWPQKCSLKTFNREGQNLPLPPVQSKYSWIPFNVGLMFVTKSTLLCCCYELCFEKKIKVKSWIEILTCQHSTFWNTNRLSNKMIDLILHWDIFEILWTL